LGGERLPPFCFYVLMGVVLEREIDFGGIGENEWMKEIA
jgi:hypothetical protein